MRITKFKPQAIFIMLGSACNFQCRYCMQRYQELPNLARKPEDKIFTFIDELSSSMEDKLTLHFYGGEPFLYLPQIREIIQRTQGMNVQYSAITNGALVTGDVVKLINSNKISTAISWDGRNTSKTRMRDVFVENRENLMSIEGLRLNAVMSAEAYPKELFDDIESLDEEYFGRHGIHINANVDRIFDTGIADKALIEDIDYERVSREMKEMFEAYIAGTLEGFQHDSIIGKIFESARDFYCEYADGRLPQGTPCSCGNGTRILNMDLDGNLYGCHNSYDIVGAVDGEEVDYISTVMAHDKVKSSGDPACDACKALYFCRRGCKLAQAPEVKASYCKVYKAYFGGMIDALLKK